MEPIDLAADVVVIGSGAAGLMAAQAASDAGARVVVVDKSIIGRGGATVLAQMTVAVALGEAEVDDPETHALDTLRAAHGLADPEIVDVVTANAPEEIQRLERYGTPWARTSDGRHAQVGAPGHSRSRCVYVDMLKTGDSVAAALRRVTRRDAQITRLHNVMITRLATSDDVVVGVVGFATAELAPVQITAPAVVIATGGMTRAYARSSASANMTGDGLLLAAEAGAVLRDLEYVQFFPIAHLWPPLVLVDPIMWDPFRYKLGGRLLNGQHEEFMYGATGESAGKYTSTRDEATRAILVEVDAGRGTPHGGVYLDFRDTERADLERAFGVIVDILAKQGIDLTRDLVEVAPMAHFTLGGIAVDVMMQASVSGLFAAGEAIHGMHGANRLSGNAITEAAVTGRIAGLSAATLRRGRRSRKTVRAIASSEWDRLNEFWHPRSVTRDEAPIGQLTARLQAIASAHVGPLRTEAGLTTAVDELGRLRHDLGLVALARQEVFPTALQEKVELRAMIDIMSAATLGALARQETRGAHVRTDWPLSNQRASTTSYRYSASGEWCLEQHPAPVQYGT